MTRDEQQLAGMIDAAHLWADEALEWVRLARGAIERGDDRAAEDFASSAGLCLRRAFRIADDALAEKRK